MSDNMKNNLSAVNSSNVNTDFIEYMDIDVSEPLYDHLNYKTPATPAFQVKFTPKLQRKYQDKSANSELDQKYKYDKSQSISLMYKKDQQLYKEMIQLNIKQDKIEKALNATAYESKTDTINWLIRHNKDLILNSDYTNPTREFILLMCPIGNLASQIETFLSESQVKCGFNEAHFNNQLPFMKLTPFFKVNDSQVLNLHKIFDHLFDSSSKNSLFRNSDVGSLAINTDLHVASQLILLYLDIDSESYLKDLTTSFCQILTKFSSNDIVPYSKQLHLTLACQFNIEHKRVLEELAIKHINYKENADWEIRLYSRDSRLEDKNVFKAVNTLQFKADNTISLKAGDHVYIDTRNVNIKSNSVLSFKGISHATGETVVLSSKNIERACESDTWQLHRGHVLVQNTVLQNCTNTLKNNVTNGDSVAKPVNNQYYPAGVNIPNSFTHGTLAMNQIPLTSVFDISKKKFSPTPTTTPTPNELKFVILRHAERVDLIFGPQWIETSFDRNGVYRRTNLNMPNGLPHRPLKRDFNGDSPITEIGKFQAKLTGEALFDERFTFTYCYVSPSLRCIQSAHHVLESMGLEKTCKIRIEPSLFEFLGWYEKGAPNFLHFEPLIDFGYNIDVNYKPLITVDRLEKEENYTDYYTRSHNLMKNLTNLHQKDGGNILIVGHAATLEVCTRQITGQQIRSYSEFNSIIRKVSYLGNCLLNKKPDQAFEILATGVNPLSHGATFNFDSMSLKA